MNVAAEASVADAVAVMANVVKGAARVEVRVAVIVASAATNQQVTAKAVGVANVVAEAVAANAVTSLKKAAPAKSARHVQTSVV